MIDAAKAVLEVIGEWSCDDPRRDATDGIRGASLLAQKGDILEIGTRLRVVMIDGPDDIDTAAWLEGEGQDASLRLMLLHTAKGAEFASEAAAAVIAKGHTVWAWSWGDFLAKMIKLDRFCKHYGGLKKTYRQSEGDDFTYVQPTAVDERALKARLVFDWTKECETAERAADDPGGLVLMIADYGEGKTSFCLNYLFHWLEDKASAGAVPVFFPLNECQAGSVDEFILSRLRSAYGLNLTADEFARLCDHGVFIGVLDAFDQMTHGAGGLRTQRDFAYIRRLGAGRSPVYVTCRRGFFEQYLKLEWEATPAPGRALALRGFDEKNLAEVLKQRKPLFELLTDPANQAPLGGLHLKPLLLHVIATHENEFREYLEDCLKREKRITEYGLFDLLFRKWLGTIRGGDGFHGPDQAAGFCRALAARARLDGMNLPIPIRALAQAPEWKACFDDAPRRQRILEELGTLPLLDRSRLQTAEEPVATFRFNIYLEFLIARFVREEIRQVAHDTVRLSAIAFIRSDPLSLETRQMLVEELSPEDDGPNLLAIVDATRFMTSGQAEYQGGNALTLVLDAMVRFGTSPAVADAWRTRFDRASFREAKLARLDARGASLVARDFSGCDLRDADFSYTNLRNVRFAKADLTGARFFEAGAVLTAAFVRSAGDRDGAPTWRVAGGTATGAVLIWADGRKVPERAQPHFEAVTALSTTPQGDRLWSASLDGIAAEKDMTGPAAARAHPLGIGPIRAMAVEEQSIIAAGDREYLLIRNISGAGIPKQLPLPFEDLQVVSVLTLTPDATRIIVGSADGLIAILSCKESGYSAAKSPLRIDGGIAAIAALSNDTLLILSRQRHALIAELDGTIRDPDPLGGAAKAIAYSPDSQDIFWIDDHALWRSELTNNGRKTQIVHLGEKHGFTVLGSSPEGNFVVAGGQQLKVWRLDKGGAEVVKEDAMLMDVAGVVIDDAIGVDPAFVERLAR